MPANRQILLASRHEGEATGNNFRLVNSGIRSALPGGLVAVGNASQFSGSRFRARWDRTRKTYCQHQKSWIIDAGRDVETAFVGGNNLASAIMSRPGHSVSEHSSGAHFSHYTQNHFAEDNLYVRPR